MCHASCIRRIRGGIVVSLLVLCAVWRTVFAATVLYENLAVAAAPLLYEKTVLYQGFAGGTYRLYLVDVSTGRRAELRNNGTSYLWPIDFGGTRAAWITYSTGSGGGGLLKARAADYPVGGGGLPIDTGGGGGGYPIPIPTAQYRIEAIDVASRTTSTVTSDQSYKDFLAMDKSTVVWTDYRHSTASDTFNEVYMCSATGQNIARVTNAVSFKAGLDVRGNRIVWQDYRNAGSVAANADIYLFDKSTNSEKAICTNNAYQAQPCIYGDIVVWQDYRNAGANTKNADIYMYNLSTGAEKAVCTNGAYQSHPVVHGDYIVWHDYRNAAAGDTSNADLYMYDLKEGAEKVVTDKPGYQGPASIYGNAAVWYDYTDRSLYFAYLDGTIAVGSERMERMPFDKPSALRTTACMRMKYVDAYDIRGRTRNARRAPAAGGVYLFESRGKRPDVARRLYLGGLQ
jgi:beta propeller repeat protein